ncbi:disease resistance protein RPV1-like [Eucalyptus grandis]|uniref:disease resistance protein RPV1-like n=1 Tax=Eucalyptus grandis TaxID=71139 RepID=UPI00192EDF1E|nr:disease resistance protein RPV1-like [Eucalyptus grandis]
MERDSGSRIEYEVFLSFRGSDSRQTFTDCLYEGMKGAGIRVFRDNDELRVGQKIKEELPRAIKNSRIYMPILSTNYASSKWCLTELATMVEMASKSNGTKEILPIYLDVNSDDVKLKTPLYRDVFVQHETNSGADQVKAWRDALLGVEEIKRLNLKNYRGYGELIKVIIQEVLVKLNAKYRLNMFSFLENVREISRRSDSLVHLQKQLLSSIIDLRFSSDTFIHDVDQGIDMIKKALCDKKMLIVLDDVDEKDQLEKLVGKSYWFEDGSRVIITTRNTSIVTDQMETLELDPPPNRPGGSSLSGVSTDKASWEETLKKLQKVPPKKVQETLMISYEGLEPTQRKVFLDIACFFIKENKKYPIFMWSDREYYPHDAIRVLLRSLIKIGDENKFSMHDQVRDLGRHIVYEENCRFPGKRSRMAKKLRVLDLRSCNCMRSTPDLSNFASLEILILAWRSKLATIDRSIINLQNLSTLNMEGCKSLQELSEEVGSLKSLTELIMPKHSLLCKLPETIGNWQSLSSLSIKWNERISRLPHSIGVLAKNQAFVYRRLQRDQGASAITRGIRIAD